MRAQAQFFTRATRLVAVVLAYMFSVFNAAAQSAVGVVHQSGEWTGHAHDAQHTGVSPVASQRLAKIHWQVPVDLAPPAGEILIHYGSPVITDTSSFRAEAHDGDWEENLEAQHRIPSTIRRFQAGDDSVAPSSLCS